MTEAAPPLLLIATTNPGKLRELGQLLAHLPLRVRGLGGVTGVPAVIEDGDTYEANARKKALAIACWSGCATLADDSGLEVDALGGAPGVHSARYGGPDQNSGVNTTKLLDALSGVPESRRTGRFRCVIAIATPDGAVLTAEGVCEGRILTSPRGRGGFGYDPVFFHPPAGQTMAELPAATKNQVSHRARACHELSPQLVEFVRAHASACAGCRLI